MVPVAVIVNDPEIEAYELVSISDEAGEISGHWGERVMVANAARPYDSRILGVIADGSSAHILAARMGHLSEEK